MSNQYQTAINLAETMILQGKSAGYIMTYLQANYAYADENGVLRAPNHAKVRAIVRVALHNVRITRFTH